MLELGFAFAALRLSAPLGFAALGELVAQRSGVLNIGIEGMMLTGAFAAFAAGAATGSAPLACAAAVAAGTAMAGVFGAFAIGRRADPIVCGTGLNLLALGGTGTAQRLLYAPGEPLPSAPQIAWPVWVALLALGALGVGLFLAYSRPGLRLRAAGERAEAAHAQGIDVRRVRWSATLFGGACAGLGGACLTLWISDTFVENMTAGRGFIALALVLFGAFRAWRILAGAALFGAASALQFRLQAAGVEIPYNLLLMTPYVLTLAVLALFAGRVRPPGDLARPFEG
ncbi:MAG: ABC transporter permease [Proteobacteria bacterium]|nr:ABC transporter permease [Pseudomonadota bacterium]